MQHAAITSSVIIGDDIEYSLFFYVMMPSPLICSKQKTCLDFYPLVFIE